MGEEMEPSRGEGREARLSERPGRDRMICPQCDGACQVTNLGGDPDDCPKCGGSGLNEKWSTPPEGLSVIEAAAWVLTATYFRQEGWAVYRIPEFEPLLLAFRFQTADEQAKLKEWRDRDYADPNPFLEPSEGEALPESPRGSNPLPDSPTPNGGPNG